MSDEKLGVCSSKQQWRWAPTKEYPVDDGTREGNADFGPECRWRNGLDFLKRPTEDKPKKFNGQVKKMKRKRKLVAVVWVKKRRKDDFGPMAVMTGRIAMRGPFHLPERPSCAFGVGVVRVADVKTSTGMYRIPVVKMGKLDIKAVDVQN